MTNLKPLTVRQERFLAAYIETDNATEAYRRAYTCGAWSANAVAVEACRLLKKPHISARLKDAVEKAAGNTDDLVKRLIERLECIALCNFSDVAKWNSHDVKFYGSRDLPSAVHAAIKSVEKRGPAGHERLRIELLDCLKASDMLLRILGTYRNDPPDWGGNTGIHFAVHFVEPEHLGETEGGD